MTAPHADQLIDGYLARLRLAAADLPPGAREELISDMRAHIAEARRRQPEETDATVLNILDRLGEPDVVAEEARQRPLTDPNAPPIARVDNMAPVRPYQPKLLELAIPGLLVLFWPIGVVLLWYSNAWNGRDKVIGTVLTLGGYPWSLGPSMLAAHTLGGTPLGFILSVALGLAPAIVAGYMTYQLRWGQHPKAATA